MKFLCPQCGHDDFEAVNEPQTVKELVNIPCNHCGRKLTINDIRRFLLIVERHPFDRSVDRETKVREALHHRRLLFQ
jgi:hypothetical protein